ncbi:universal stress protein [Tunturibacter empetritectus]|uniref:Nucleotide-binding universal stress UspA family protein n=1 Tax=Tunturiibacter empetritectus TaxID=3069691 RepID=A0A7W8MR46_9BACT|nr:universal stress protein [Edaphobacter lichenicola]MBB5317248.1 nucleotide-binding universal stress UspA family protein [Edaphobacter lichenicola]
MFKKIAVAFDESPEAGRAFHSALELAKFSSATLHLITVLEGFPAYMSYVAAVAPNVPILLKEEKRSFYSDLQGKAKAEADRAGVSLSLEIAEGEIVGELLRLIEEIKPDLLAIGLRHGHGTVGRLLGGTAHQLAVHSKCPLLGVH